jgi:hypothetical protein
MRQHETPPANQNDFVKIAQCDTCAIAALNLQFAAYFRKIW